MTFFDHHSREGKSPRSNSGAEGCGIPGADPHFDSHNNEGAASPTTPITERLAEFACLVRLWIQLTLRDLGYSVRENVAEIVSLVGGLFFGVALVLGGVVILDLLLYRWLQLAFDSSAWALFLLSMAHLGAGAYLIRTVMARLRVYEEDDEEDDRDDGEGGR